MRLPEKRGVVDRQLRPSSLLVALAILARHAFDAEVNPVELQPGAQAFDQRDDVAHGQAVA
jgi:hypothetical protein